MVLVLILCFPFGREFLAQIADRANTLAIDGSNDVASFYARLFRRRTGIHFANQNALAIGSSKECGELAVEIFRINPEARGTTHQEPAAVPFHGRNHRNFRHAKRELSGSAGPGSQDLEGVAALFGFPESNGYGLGVAITPHGELCGAPRGNLADHAAKLRRAFDALPIDFRDDVVFLETRFRGRTVRNDGAENDAAFGG